MSQRATLQTGESVSALDPNQILAVLSGLGVVDGGEVHDAAEPFSVQVFSARAFFPATDTKSATTELRQSATIDLRDYVDDFAPRKVLICVPRTATGNAAGGAFEVVAGDPEKADPQGKIRQEASKPALPDLDDSSRLSGTLTTEDVVPLYAAWIGANASEITEDDLWDRRQSADVIFRRVTGQTVDTVELIDGDDVSHTGELADAADVRTDSDILGVVSNSPTHGEDAQHNYRTDTEIRGAIRDIVDVKELSGAAGANGNLVFTDGTSPYYAAPPAEWGDPFDQSVNTTDDVVVNSIRASNADSASSGDTAIDVDGPVEWSDGTRTETSPIADSGGVAVISDLGDATKDVLANRPAPSGSGEIYIAVDENGIYYDLPAANPATWIVVAAHPSDIEAGELGFDPATQGELDTVSSDLTTHTNATGNVHNATAADVGALADAAGSVGLDNIDTDLTTQAELTTHTGEASAHHTRPTIDEMAQSVNGKTISPSVVQPKVVAGQVIASHADFNSAQDAVTFAANNGYRTVLFHAGTYPGGVNVNTDSMILKGVSGANGALGDAPYLTSDTGRALFITADGVQVENLRLQSATTAPAIRIDDTSQNVTIEHCLVTRGSVGISCAGDQCVIEKCEAVSANISGSGLDFSAGANQCIALGNTGLFPVTDSGTNNKHSGLNV